MTKPLQATLDPKGDKIHTYQCSCGMTVRGHGAKRSHQRVHFRRGDGHRYLTDADRKAASK